MNTPTMLFCCAVASVVSGQTRSVSLLPGESVRPRASIETIDSCNTSVGISIPSIGFQDVVTGGNNYQAVDIAGFSTSKDLGNPELPVVRFSLVVPPGMKPKIRIIRAADTIIGKVTVAPVLEPGTIGSDHGGGSEVRRNESIYSRDSFYPPDIAVIRESGIYRGNEIAFFEIHPVACNCVRKELRVMKHLDVLVTMTPARSGAELSHGSYSGEAPLQFRYGGRKTGRTEEADSRAVPPGTDTAIDVIIITVPALKAAADSLALWHAMKGYESKIVTSDAWTTRSIKDSVLYYYKNTMPSPSYLLFLGNEAQVPSWVFYHYGLTVHSDFHYALMDGGADKIPDLARGRLPASTIGEANAVVRKILQFERTPPQTPSFYSNVLAAAYFQPDDSGTSYESRIFRFSKTVEDARTYLAGKSYMVTRAYFTRSGYMPTQWWSGNALVDIPQELQKPQFPWNADAALINNVIDKGAFLAYHYDHGEEIGWVDPEWNVNTMSLKNGELLPVIYSINCETGNFPMQTVCFAEKLLCAETGGAVAVLAATQATDANPNIVLVKSLIEVTWPGYAGDGKIEPPVFTMGDILDKSFIRIENLDDYTKKVYLLFGDPTTKLYTRVPSVITATHAATLDHNAKFLALSALSADKGIATLVDKKTAKIHGKVPLQGPTASLPVTGTIPDGADLVLTITNDNCRPYQAAIGCSGMPVKPTGKKPDRGMALLRIETMRPIALEGSGAVDVSMYTPLGKIVYKKRISELHGTVVIGDCLKANGVYCLRVHSIETGGNRFFKLVRNSRY